LIWRSPAPWFHRIFLNVISLELLITPPAFSLYSSPETIFDFLRQVFKLISVFWISVDSFPTKAMGFRPTPHLLFFPSCFSLVPKNFVETAHALQIDLFSLDRIST